MNYDNIPLDKFKIKTYHKNNTVLNNMASLVYNAHHSGETQYLSPYILTSYYDKDTEKILIMVAYMPIPDDATYTEWSLDNIINRTKTYILFASKNKISGQYVITKHFITDMHLCALNSIRRYTNLFKIKDNEYMLMASGNKQYNSISSYIKPTISKISIDFVNETVKLLETKFSGWFEPDRKNTNSKPIICKYISDGKIITAAANIEYENSSKKVYYSIKSILNTPNDPTTIGNQIESWDPYGSKEYEYVSSSNLYSLKNTNLYVMPYTNYEQYLDTYYDINVVIETDTSKETLLSKKRYEFIIVKGKPNTNWYIFNTTTANAFLYLKDSYYFRVNCYRTPYKPGKNIYKGGLVFTIYTINNSNMLVKKVIYINSNYIYVSNYSNVLGLIQFSSRTIFITFTGYENENKDINNDICLYGIYARISEDLSIIELSTPIKLYRRASNYNEDGAILDLNDITSDQVKKDYLKTCICTANDICTISLAQKSNTTDPSIELVTVSMLLDELPTIFNFKADRKLSIGTKIKLTWEEEYLTELTHVEYTSYELYENINNAGYNLTQASLAKEFTVKYTKGQITVQYKIRGKTADGRYGDFFISEQLSISQILLEALSVKENGEWKMGPCSIKIANKWNDAVIVWKKEGNVWKSRDGEEIK